LTNPEITKDTRLEVPRHVYARSFGDELVLLDFGRGDYFGLGDVGSVMWSTLEQGGCIGDAVSRVVAAFEGAQPPEVERDLVSLAAELVEQGLLAVVGEARSAAAP
jgi:hypothetical protein